MKYEERIMDLFSVDDSYYLAHCISADFGMGRGIVVEFNRRFNMKNILKTKYPDYLDRFSSNKIKGDCILEDRVFNLITKERYFHKPTYDSMYFALQGMKCICRKNNINKIAMPLIGCGLDKLEWSKVSDIIRKVFDDTSIEILVCKVN